MYPGSKTELDKLFAEIYFFICKKTLLSPLMCVEPASTNL